MQATVRKRKFPSFCYRQIGSIHLNTKDNAVSPLKLQRWVKERKYFLFKIYRINPILLSKYLIFFFF